MTVTPHVLTGRPEPPPGFSHATVAQGSRVVHISGQVGTDETGAVVGGGLAAQMERAMLNLAEVLRETGARQEDLASVRINVVGWEPSMLEDLGRGAAAAGAQIEGAGAPAVTLIGVSSLFTPDMLVEIEAIAVVD
jgi:enamine deaminase RidA (YjgF/YER057c/UK114 family)